MGRRREKAYFTVLMEVGMKVIFEDNEMEGKGIYYYANGNKYEGDYKAGKMDGKGIIYCVDGRRYEGDWKDGIKDGKGIFYFADDSRYEGEL